jgi:hypothetical protein
MIRDGRQNAFLREFGKTVFDYARANPDAYGAVFARAMSGFSAISVQMDARSVARLRLFLDCHLV